RYEKLVTIKDVAKELDITKSTVSDMLEVGILPHAGVLRSFGGRKEPLTFVTRMMEIFSYIEGTVSNEESEAISLFIKRRDAVHKANQRQGIITGHRTPGEMFADNEVVRAEWAAVCGLW